MAHTPWLIVASDVLAGGIFAKGGRLRTVNGALMDMQTANMLVTVHDALNDENKAKFKALPLMTAVKVGWKLVK